MHVCLDWAVFVFIWQGTLSLGQVFQEWDDSPRESNYEAITTLPLMTSMTDIYMNWAIPRSVIPNLEIQNSELTATLITGSEFRKSETLMTSSEDTELYPVTTLYLATPSSTITNAELSSMTASGYGYLATPSLTICNADETRSLISKTRELDNANTQSLTSAIGQPSQQRKCKLKTKYNGKTTLSSVTRMGGMYTKLTHSSLARASNEQTEHVNSTADPNDPSTSLINTSLNKAQPRFDCDSSYLLLMMKKQCKAELKDEFFCLDDAISCRDRCGMEAITRCSCELHCELYGTCCVDFRSECPDLWFDAKERLSGILGVTVECIDNSPGYILISSCSQNSSAHIVSKCLGDNIEPVSISNYHFKNTHCLLCNGFVETDAESWNLNLFVEFGRDTDRSFFEKTDISLILSHGIFQWTPPALPSLHFCSDMIISDCPDGNDMQLKDKCLASRSPVIVIADGKRTLYHNRYCAACHVKSSLYVCNGAAISDFAHVTQGPARYSTIINWKINSDKTKAILYAARPFLWRMMTCNISENDVKMPDCIIAECYNSLQVINHICALSACAKAFINWNGHHQVVATCTDQPCLNDTTDAMIDRMLTKIIQTVQGEFPSMTLGATSRNTEKYELYIQMQFNNWDRASSDSETLQRLFDLFQHAVENDQRSQLTSGSTISVKIGFTSNTNCLVKYHSRNITIIGPTPNMESIPSSGGGSYCSFLAALLACLFLN
ncbi:hypothetical protein SNE40_013643 [Patella caerulea]|uniref:SMB domain-containing protein n=1 Tax=Patella caerulea TaxID=87958 RepID=A0AAN8JJQ8_PATCE